MNNFALGKYMPLNSPIHRMDPRAKIMAMLIVLIAIFFPAGFLGYAIIAACAVAVVLIAKLSLNFVWRSMKPMLFMLLFLLIVNILVLRTGAPLVTILGFTIYSDAVFQTLYIAIRLMLMIVITTVLTATTKPLDLTLGIEDLLQPFQRFHLPSHEIAMMISIALRFIPILLEETDKIMKAQIARGADLESGNIIQRAKAMIPILVPLFVSAFRRANDLAMAMEARCYRGGEGRTKMKPLVYHSRDRVAYLVTAVYLAVIIVLGRFVPFHIWIF